jgi:hypothetical protein
LTRDLQNQRRQHQAHGVVIDRIVGLLQVENTEGDRQVRPDDAGVRSTRNPGTRPMASTRYVVRKMIIAAN